MHEHRDFWRSSIASLALGAHGIRRNALSVRFHADLPAFRSWLIEQIAGAFLPNGLWNPSYNGHCLVHQSSFVVFVWPLDRLAEHRSLLEEKPRDANKIQKLKFSFSQEWRQLRSVAARVTYSRRTTCMSCAPCPGRWSVRPFQLFWVTRSPDTHG